MSEAVFKEWEPLVQLLSLIPAKGQRFGSITSIDIELTSVDVCESCLALGTNMSIVYIFDRHKEVLCAKYKCGPKNDDITTISLKRQVSEYTLVAGTASGQIYYCKFPHPLRASHNEISINHLPQVLRGSITAVCLDESSAKVYCGDNSGMIVQYAYYTSTSVWNYTVLVQESDAVLQLSHCLNHLIISTKAQSLSLNLETATVCKLGSSDRKTFGSYGSCVSISCSAPEATIYATRPGQRLWRCLVNGSVVCTSVYKGLLEAAPTVQLCAPLQTAQDNAETPNDQFGRILELDDSTLVTWNNHSVYLLSVTEQNTSRVAAVCRAVGPILCVSCWQGELYILRRGIQRRLIHISRNPPRRDLAETEEVTGENIARGAAPASIQAKLALLKGKFATSTAEFQNVKDNMKQGLDSLFKKIQPKSVPKGTSESAPTQAETRPQLSSLELSDLKQAPAMNAEHTQQKQDIDDVQPSEDAENFVTRLVPHNTTKVLKPAGNEFNQPMNIKGPIDNACTALMLNSGESTQSPDTSAVLVHIKQEGDFELGSSQESSVSIPSYCATADTHSLDSTNSPATQRHHLHVNADELGPIHSASSQHQEAPAENSSSISHSSERCLDSLSAVELLGKLDSLLSEPQSVLKEVMASDSETHRNHSESHSHTASTDESRVDEASAAVGGSSDVIATQNDLDVDSVSSSCDEDDIYKTFGIKTKGVLAVQGIADDTLSSTNLGLISSEDSYISPLVSELWMPSEVPSYGTGIALSNQFIWITDKAGQVWISKLSTRGLIWKSLEIRASQIAVSPSGSLAWRVQQGRAYAGSCRVPPITPARMKWTEAVQQVSSVAVDETTAWYIHNTGEVWCQNYLSKDRPVKHGQQVPCCHSLTKIVTRQGITWALTKDRRLLSYNSSRSEWNAVGSANNIVDVSLGDDGSAWILDADDKLWFALAVSSLGQHGSSQWWQVCYTERIDHENRHKFVELFKVKPTKMSYTGRLAVGLDCVAVLPCTQQNVLYLCLGHVVGHQWRGVTPAAMTVNARWRFLCCATDRTVWALYETDELMYVNTETGVTTQVPLPPKRRDTKVQFFASTSDTLWLVMSDGTVFYSMAYLSSVQLGLLWQQLCTIQLNNEKLVCISVGDSCAWSVDHRGKVYMCFGPRTAHQLMSPAWVEVDSSQPNAGFEFVTVQTNQRCSIVWALDSKGRTFARKGITENLPIGSSWVQVVGAIVSSLTVSNDHVWAITQSSNQIVCRCGITKTNCTGDFWKKVPGTLSHLAASPNGRLFGLNLDGNLMQHHFVTWGNVKAISLAEEVDGGWQMI